MNAAWLPPPRRVAPPAMCAKQRTRGRSGATPENFVERDGLRLVPIRQARVACCIGALRGLGSHRHYVCKPRGKGDRHTRRRGLLATHFVDAKRGVWNGRARPLRPCWLVNRRHVLHAPLLQPVWRHEASALPKRWVPARVAEQLGRNKRAS